MGKVPKQIFSIIALSLLAGSAVASQCRTVSWQAGTVVKVNSALYLGTRIQLPEGTSIVTQDPFSSNPLWQISGAANQVTIQPSSDQPEGKKSMITVFMTNGEALDIEANRVPEAQNQQCVIIKTSGMSNRDRAALTAGYNQTSPQAAQMQQQMQVMQQAHEADNKQAVTEALRRYRYFVYTRYNWSTGKGFAGKNLIADVYDDGRFTYIRLSKPSRGLLAVSAEVGGKEAIVPTKYDDTYNIYQMSGIYPKFALTLDGQKVNVTRADNGTNGES
ncbi:TrbG/VirB9 family P-type conjugative transfer protein [Providencia rettgeri]|uniref:TrbG/VirB9 family P-type conjugative transfer protein n=1 Tax=Providencia rettgeri TaxID=587 RepID=UPI00141914A5|nr:TrbG/VirB9 family P-type conjugative transfer protein [Providencia rettgeri]NIH07058.1 TrbG/VirB9 family P-type conjugative transfer protein [Providencia rettgeri]